MKNRMPSPNCERRDTVPDQRLSWRFGNGANRTLPVSAHRSPDLFQAWAVSVRLEEGGRMVTGRGADTDTMVASARAYVSALNKLMVKRQKTARVQQQAL